jgi:hypothetical protein
VWNKDSKVLSVLPNQTNDAPWDSTRSPVTVDEEVHPILGQFPPEFKMLVHESDSIISDLNLMTRTGRRNVRNHQPVVSGYL